MKTFFNIVLFFFNEPLGGKRYVFFGTELLFSKRSCSAAIASWKDFRTIAPTYFCMGNPFLIVPQVFGHSIYRFHDANVARLTKNFGNIVDLHRFSLNFNDFHWI